MDQFAVTIEACKQSLLQIEELHRNYGPGTKVRLRKILWSLRRPAIDRHLSDLQRHKSTFTLLLSTQTL
jgi:hypothetical protein